MIRTRKIIGGGIAGSLVTGSVALLIVLAIHSAGNGIVMGMN
jgi:hypothetical protein